MTIIFRYLKRSQFRIDVEFIGDVDDTKKYDEFVNFIFIRFIVITTC
jgi:hypothetical protein